MKHKIQIALMLLSLSVVFSCSKMNDKHDFYLEDGEIIYLGRVDSAKILPGKNRFLLRYWITDNRAKELNIYWNQMANSFSTPIPAHQPTDSIDVIIGDEANSIPEGSYTFQLISNDGSELESIVFESLGNVYGEQFSLLMSDRYVKSVGYNPDLQEVSVEWGEPSSSRDIGVELTYYKGDTKNVIKVPTKQLTSKTILDSVNVEKGVTYRTMFLPEPVAIDTFYTAPVSLTILQNVALGKPVKTSSDLNSTYPGAKAVDGIVSADSRWISSSASGLEHWIEIDLEKEYSLYSFKFHKHLYNNFLIPNFTFQINKNGEWVDLVEVENYLGEIYESMFSDEVITDKVRIFIPSYLNNQARVYEFAVYVKY